LKTKNERIDDLCDLILFWCCNVPRIWSDVSLSLKMKFDCSRIEICSCIFEWNNRSYKKVEILEPSLQTHWVCEEYFVRRLSFTSRYWRLTIFSETCASVLNQWLKMLNNFATCISPTFSIAGADDNAFSFDLRTARARSTVAKRSFCVGA